MCGLPKGSFKTSANPWAKTKPTKFATLTSKEDWRCRVSVQGPETVAGRCCNPCAVSITRTHISRRNSDSPAAGQKFAAMAQAFAVDAMADAGRQMPLGRHVEGGQPLGRLEQRLRRDQVVAVAVHQQHRWPRFDFGGKSLSIDVRWQHQEAGIADDGGRRCGAAQPTCSAIIVPWLKPTRASAEAGSLWRASSASRKRLSTGAALLTPTQRSLGSRNVSGNHCRPTGA